MIPLTSSLLRSLLHGKGLVSSTLYKKIYSAAGCGPSPWKKINLKCDALLEQSSKQAGPHNVYDIYDNCPKTKEYLKHAGGKSMRWLLKKLRAQMDSYGTAAAGADDGLFGGGYHWSAADVAPPALLPAGLAANARALSLQVLRRHLPARRRGALVRQARRAEGAAPLGPGEVVV